MSAPLLRKVGDKVFVVSDNMGMDAEIIDIRESEGSPPARWKVRTSDGQEFWAYDFAVSDA
jgi:hypothetical protein